MEQKAAVIQSNIEEVVQEIIQLLTAYGLEVLGAFVILVAGLWAAGRARSWTIKVLVRTGKVEPTLQGFLGSIARYIVIAVTVLAVLQQFGVQTASLIAVFGAAGLAIGLAMQGTLSNIAAGVMLLIFRPYNVGDYVEAGGAKGTVKELGLFTTELATPDNIHVVVPNAQIWGTAVKNYSHYATRRMDLTLGIDYGDDIEKAIAACTAAIAAEARAMDDPEPLVAVRELADSSVNLVVRVWCRNEDYWPLKFDLTRALKESCDRAGISIPFPQRVVHMVKDAG